VDPTEAAKNALECVFHAKKGESIVIFCDEEKTSIGEAFSKGALLLGLKTHLVALKATAEMRKEIPPEALRILDKQKTDIFVNLLRGNWEETTFRIRLTKMETKNPKTRLGHCPGITLDMLTEGAMSLTTEDHRKMQSFAGDLMRRLKHATRLEITNPSGTNISMSVEGRPFFTDTVMDLNKPIWINMPTGEVTVAPVENSLEGKLICDMAIGGIGPIESPVRITAIKGKAEKTETTSNELKRTVEASLATDENSGIVGEFAFGINPRARFVKEFLEAEKILGTVHIAFGNNSEMPGGKNPSKNHMDLLISKPTVKIFEKESSTILLAEGIFMYR
jgi:leucyl aminopeptidase (aminopeptidase T)